MVPGESWQGLTLEHSSLIVSLIHVLKAEFVQSWTPEIGLGSIHRYLTVCRGLALLGAMQHATPPCIDGPDVMSNSFLSCPSPASLDTVILVFYAHPVTGIRTPMLVPMSFSQIVGSGDWFGEVGRSRMRLRICISCTKRYV